MKKTLGLMACLFASTALAAEGQWVKSKGIVHFIIEGPIDDVHGESRTVSGVIDLDPESWAKMKGSVAVDLDTVRTGIDQRDEDMRVEFLQTKRFPKAVLTVDSIERPSGANIAVGASVKGEVSGSFEVHGVRRKVTFTLNVTRTDADHVRAAGTFDIPFADYSIQRPSRLFLKLGDTAKVIFDVTFVRKTETAPPAVIAAAAAPVQPTVAQVLPEAPKPKPKPKRKPKPPLVFKYQFTNGDAKSRGEKLFHSEATGGPGNKMTCFHCHAKGEDKDLKDDHVRAARTLFNSSQRKQFWNGFATDPAKAASICQKQFMLGNGLTPEQETDVVAFLDAVGQQATPELDYTVNYRSMEVLLQDPTGGNAANGKKLADKYCMTCHLDGRVGPVWAPGLYEPDWVVRRVRRLEGHQNKQMPNWSQARLPDADLRDIVTYLTSPASAPPVFNRKKPAPATAPGKGGQP